MKFFMGLFLSLMGLPSLAAESRRASVDVQGTVVLRTLDNQMIQLVPKTHLLLSFERAPLLSEPVEFLAGYHSLFLKDAQRIVELSVPMAGYESPELFRAEASRTGQQAAVWGQLEKSQVVVQQVVDDQFGCSRSEPVIVPSSSCDSQNHCTSVSELKLQEVPGHQKALIRSEVWNESLVVHLQSAKGLATLRTEPLLRQKQSLVQALGPCH